MSEDEIEEGDIVSVTGHPVWYRNLEKRINEIGEVVKIENTGSGRPYLIDFKFRGPVRNHLEAFPTDSENVGWLDRESIELTPPCLHKTNPVYHDVEEEWVCPFCYD